MRSAMTKSWRLACAAVTVFVMISAPAAGQATDEWKARWDKLVAAAEKEGGLNISGPSGRIWRDEMFAFQEAYPKIKLIITPAASRDFWPRIFKERQVGQNLWDLRIGGADTEVYELIQKGSLADVREMLILPEVAEETVWHGGFDHMFTDRSHRYAASFGATTSPLARFNPEFVKPGELKSFRDLLDPKWKGKIALADPRGGATAVSMAIVYKKYGPDFIKDLLTRQQPVIVTDPRQIVTWFASGTYPIAMGMPNATIQQFVDSGVKFKMAEVSGLDIWSVGVCGIQVLEPRPHPNATIVFINWLLTKDVQAKIMKAVRLNSRRKDIPLGDPESAVDWNRYKDYVSGQSEDYYEAMLEFKKLAQTLIK